MDLKLTAEQMETIKNIAQREGIFDCRLNINNATSKGDGYSGSLLNITIEGENNKLYLILKQAEPTNNIKLRIFRRTSYLREIYVYNNVLREFENFQKENNVKDGFNAFARIYGSSDEENCEYVLLENLKQNGFRMWNRRVPMNDEHLAAVFTEYGKFHALSLAMREKKPEIYHELERNLDDFYINYLPKDDAALTIKYKIEFGLKVVENNEEAAKLFQRFADTAEKFMLEDTANTEDHLVITHADCWCNNFLFKYENVEDAQKLSKVCFIDWQLSKIGSPVLDLAYFFFVCAAGDTLHDYKKYLKIYHNAVSESLTKFSCDVEKLFPYALLECHWKKYAKYGLYTLLMTVNLMLLDTDEEISTDSVKSDADQPKSKNVEDSASQRVIDVINVLNQYDLI